MKSLVLGVAVALVLAFAPNMLHAPVRQEECFPEVFAEWLQRRGVPVSDKQREALETAHPLLLIAADDRLFARTFWRVVRSGDPTNIDWQEAVGRIHSGEIVEVFQTHTLDVHLIAIGGEYYNTKAPHMDAVFEAVDEVDPRKLFVTRVTE